MENIFKTFIIDFQSINFEHDLKIAKEIFENYQRQLCLDNAFAFDSPIKSAGWSFSKLYIAARMVEMIYRENKTSIDKSRGKRFDQKFIFWLNSVLRKENCEAQIKMSQEMN